MRSRTVVVVGPDAFPDIEQLAQVVAAVDGELAVLSVGHPLSPAQRRLVDTALELAADLRITCEVRLLWTLDQIEDHVQESNTVLVMPGALTAAEPTAVPTVA